MNITKDVFYIGVNDRELDLFESQFEVPNGMSYNWYVISDEKIAVLDTVDRNFTEEWLGNLASVLNDKLPDYLILHHMEPDHSASIVAFLNRYPDTKIVATATSFSMLKNFYGNPYKELQIVMNDGGTLSLGNHLLTFYTAPMVHWPEVMVSYDSYEKILFSADAFGKFGTFDADEDWACEARRYYFGIIGKYGTPVQSLLKKLSGLTINTICSLHGPILRENLKYYFNLYNIWSSYSTESEGALIAYTSVYGNTKAAVELLAEKLKENGCMKVTVTNLAREDMAEAVEDAFRYGKIVFATTTYNTGIFPFMKVYIDHLTERNFQNKFVAFIENGSWAPTATKTMKTMLENCKNLTFAENSVKILSAVNEQNRLEIKALAKELCK